MTYAISWTFFAIDDRQPEWQERGDVYCLVIFYHDDLREERRGAIIKEISDASCGQILS